MIRHIVLLRFTDAADEARRAQIAADFAALRGLVDGIVDLEWGLNVSPELLDKGYTHGFVVSFTDVAARDNYLPHPAHRAFVARLEPWLADVLVFDYAVG